MTNHLGNYLHRLKGRHYARRASILRRDLTEYVISEESRITVLLHRAAWHFTRGRMASIESASDHGPILLPPTPLVHESKPLPPKADPPPS